jgi:hypothetical protein
MHFAAIMHVTAAHSGFGYTLAVRLQACRCTSRTQRSNFGLEVERRDGKVHPST